LTPGYDSHYVLTGYRGLPSDNELFDEIVIPQNHQIVPAFVLKLEPKSVADRLGLFREQLIREQTDENRIETDESEQINLALQLVDKLGREGTARLILAQKQIKIEDYLSESEGRQLPTKILLSDNELEDLINK